MSSSPAKAKSKSPKKKNQDNDVKSPTKQQESTTVASTATTAPSAGSANDANKQSGFAALANGASIFGNSSSTTATFPSVNAFSFAPATFGSSVASKTAVGGDDDDEDGGEGGEGNDADESHAAEFKPLVQLEKVQVKTMEEDEEVVLKVRAKLYIFIKEDLYGGEVRKNYWKERGLGDVKVLKHKETGLSRLLMRQEKTLKICMNHLISPAVNLAPNVGTDKSWVFTAQDFSDEVLKVETFAIKFSTPEIANSFKDAVEAAKQSNAKKIGEQEAANNLSGSVSSISIDGAKKEMPVAENKPTIVGGFSEKAASDENVIKAGKFATEKIGLGEFVKVAAAQTQVVAGMNYKLVIHIKYNMDNAIHAHKVTVYEPLPHTNEPMQLKENAHVGAI